MKKTTLEKVISILEEAKEFGYERRVNDLKLVRSMRYEGLIEPKLATKKPSNDRIKGQNFFVITKEGNMLLALHDNMAVV